MQFLNNPLIMPLGALAVVSIYMVFDSVKKMHETEIEAYRDLRIREMEHLLRVRALDAEHIQGKPNLRLNHGPRRGDEQQLHATPAGCIGGQSQIP